MLISFELFSFELLQLLLGYLRDPECPLKNISCGHLLLYPLLIFPAFPTPPLPAHLTYSPPPSHSSFLVAPPFPLSSLLYLVHLPCRAEVRVRGQLPGRTTEPVLDGVVMYLCFVLSLCFILPDNSFPQEIASLLLPVTCFMHIYVCVRRFSCMHACVFACVYAWVDASVSSSPLLTPFAQPCLFALLSFLFSISLPCLTFFSVPSLLHR